MLHPDCRSPPSSTFRQQGQCICWQVEISCITARKTGTMGAGLPFMLQGNRGGRSGLALLIRLVPRGVRPLKLTCCSSCAAAVLSRMPLPCNAKQPW